MESEQFQKVIDQALAMANNYIQTGRQNKAIEMLSQVRKLDDTNQIATNLMDFIAAPHLGRDLPQLPSMFGQHWLGQPLDGKSIQIFCDQGMGDTINLLRYLWQMKQRWNCRIVLNCYAFHHQFKRLLADLPYIDELTKHHVECDYSTNIMSLPALLSELSFDIYYPVHWRDVMTKTTLPHQPKLGPYPKTIQGSERKVGLVWKTNPDNFLSEVKSIPVTSICQLENGKFDLFELAPDKDSYNFVTQPAIDDLYDTACLIESMDVVVTVDTCVLHLAGAMEKTTFGLLPFDCDPRWGRSRKTPWYPTVELFRQPDDLDWSAPISKVKEKLESFFNLR